VRALVGGYGRDAHLDAAVGGPLKATDGGPPGLWLTPCGDHPPTRAEVDGVGTLPDLAGAARVAVGDVTGEALAAYGVLQCAAAVEWLAGHPGERALLTSGGCWGGEYAGITLAGVA
jgi:hypothetical protein